MAEEDPVVPLPDLRPTKILWDDASVTIQARMFAGAREVGTYQRTLEINDPRLTANQRTQLIGVIRAIARLFGDIP